MDDLTPQPIQPAYNPGETHRNDPGPGGRKPKPKPVPETPEVEAPEDLIDIGDEDEHSVDTFATSIEESLNAYRQSLASTLEAWRELETAVSDGCEAIVRMDLESIEEQTANQERVCSLIGRLEQDQAALREVLELSYALKADANLRELGESIEECRARVRDANQVQERLTTHSSQLVKRISNALVRFFTTYPEPHAGGSTPGR